MNKTLAGKGTSLEKPSVTTRTTRSKSVLGAPKNTLRSSSVMSGSLGKAVQGATAGRLNPGVTRMTRKSGTVTSSGDQPISTSKTTVGVGQVAKAISPTKNQGLVKTTNIFTSVKRPMKEQSQALETEQQGSSNTDANAAINVEWLRGKDISEFCMAYMKDSKIQLDSLASIQKLLTKATSVPNAFIIRKNRLGINSAIAISRILKERDHIQMLDIHENVIRDNGCIALCDNLLSNSHIEYLDIGSNDISNRGILRLAELLENPDCPLKVLILGSDTKDMYGNKYDSAVATKLCQSVVNSSLQYVDFSRNNLFASHSQYPFKVISTWFTKVGPSSEEQDNDTLDKEIKLLDIVHASAADAVEVEGVSSDGKLQLEVATDEVLDGAESLENANGEEPEHSNNTSKSKILNLEFEEEEEEKYLKILSLAHKRLIEKQENHFMDYNSVFSDVIPLTQTIRQSNENPFKTQIHTIKLAFSGMQDTSFINIMQSALSSEYFFLKEIDIAGNDISSEVCSVLSKYISHSSCRLETLNMSHNKINKSGIELLKPGLIANVTLKNLNLGYNMLADDSCPIIANIIRENQSIQSLGLESNGILLNGAVLIAKALKDNHTIQTLKLGKNRIQDEGAFALGETFKLHDSIAHIDLRACGIGDKGVFSIIASLGFNNTLRTIILRNNHLTDDSGKAFYEILSKNQEVTSIDVRGNQIDHATQSRIGSLLGQNKVSRKSRKPEHLKREIIRLKYYILLLEKGHQKLREERKAREQSENKLAAFKEQDRKKRDKLEDQILNTKQNIAVELQTLTEIEEKIEISREDNSRFLRECESRIALMEKTINDVSNLYTLKQKELEACIHELSTNYNANVVSSMQKTLEDTKAEIADLQTRKLEQFQQIESLKAQLAQFEGTGEGQ